MLDLFGNHIVGFLMTQLNNSYSPCSLLHKLKHSTYLIKKVTKIYYIKIKYTENIVQLIYM